MKFWVVTFKFLRNPEHNPNDKKEGECILSKLCTDATGAHHSLIFCTPNYDRLNQVREMIKDQIGDKIHVTRIELVEPLL